MQEIASKKTHVFYWVVVTERENKLTAKEMDHLFKAEQSGARLVRFDSFGISIPFIKDMYTVEKFLDTVPPEMEKFIIGIETKVIKLIEENQCPKKNLKP